MKHILIGSAVSVIYFVILVKTLPDYGMNMDSPGKFLRGQTYLQVLTSGSDRFDQPSLPSPVLFYPGQRVSLTFPNNYENRLAPVTPVRTVDPTKTVQQQFIDYRRGSKRQSIYKHNAFNLAYWNVQDQGHPPVSDILMAITNRMFYERLGWLGDSEAYHIYPLVLAVLTVLVVFLFTASLWSMLPAIIAAVTLGLFPFFFAESHFNIKDVPATAFTTLAIVTSYYWVTSRKVQWYILLLVSFFLGFGTKFTLLYIPAIVALWLYSIRRTHVFIQWWTRGTRAALVVLFVLPLVVLMLIWPYLWTNPVLRLVDIVGFYLDLSGMVGPRSLPFYLHILPFSYLFRGINLQAILLAFGVTPIPIVLLLTVGITVAIRHRRKAHHEHFLLLLWLILPIAKHVLLRIYFYGNIRQYSEFLPALAMLSGIGASHAIRFVSQRLNIKLPLLAAISAVLYASSLTALIASRHPNQNIFFNSLFGGFNGARNFFNLLLWEASYTNPYKQAILWLNQNAEPNAKLVVLDGTMSAISPMSLRPDIDFGSHFSQFDRGGEYIITFSQEIIPNEFYYPYLNRFLTPLHVISYQNVPLLTIWRNSDTYLKQGMDDFEDVYAFEQVRDQSSDRWNWRIDFGSSKKIVSLSMTIPMNNCTKPTFSQQDMVWFDMGGMMRAPYFVERSSTTYELRFPAAETDYILLADAKRTGDTGTPGCFYEGTVTNIRALKEH